MKVRMKFKLTPVEKARRDFNAAVLTLVGEKVGTDALCRQLYLLFLEMLQQSIQDSSEVTEGSIANMEAAYQGCVEKFGSE